VKSCLQTLLLNFLSASRTAIIFYRESYICSQFHFRFPKRAFKSSISFYHTARSRGGNFKLCNLRGNGVAHVAYRRCALKSFTSFFPIFQLEQFPNGKLIDLWPILIILAPGAL